MPVHPTTPFNALPFDGLAACRLREALGMGPEHVAYGLYAQYGIEASPGLVVAWERGMHAPDARELIALAGVLWCASGDLQHAPRTLREHRAARGLAAADLAQRIGIGVDAYARMEETRRWHGTERQSAALATELGLSAQQFATAAGRDEELAELLQSAVTTRWQAYVRPLAKLLLMPRTALEGVLPRLHANYQGQMVATLGWGAGDAGGEAGGREFLEEIVGHFWEQLKGVR